LWIFCSFIFSPVRNIPSNDAALPEKRRLPARGEVALRFLERVMLAFSLPLILAGCCPISPSAAMS
jgi:hypothetical protein